MNKIVEALAHLDEVANTDEAIEAAYALGDALSEHIGKQVNLNKVSKRDASILMVTFGASAWTVRTHAARVAKRMRSNRLHHGSWGAIV